MAKLTLISVWVRGRRFSAFVDVEPNYDGKIRVPLDYIQGMIGCGNVRGLTLIVGG